MRATLRVFLPVTLAAALAASAGAIEVPELGSLDFPNSGSEEAQLAFARGVLLLHSFEYPDAREAFQEARAIDPDFALAYWGEAMTHNHPLWREQDTEAARAVLEELGSTPGERLAKAPGEREKGYLKALEALYFGPGDKVARDHAYEEAMRSLSAAFPDDLEAKAFYALSILGSAQGVRDFRVYMRAGAVAEEVFAANPRHPGAAHYLIHSYDDPIHAPLGLRAARVYAEIAPAATHAQHMISHIFVGLGRWEEVAAANIKAWDVSVARAESKGLGVDARNYHALHWLQYAHLQQGKHRLAASELERMRVMASQSLSPRALWYHAVMRAAQVVEAGSEAPRVASDGSDASPWLIVFDAFTQGWREATAGDPEPRLGAEPSASPPDRRCPEPDCPRSRAVRAMAAGIREAIAEASDQEDSGTDVYRSFSDQDRMAAEVMALELEALAHHLEGAAAAVVATLEAATELESSRALEFGPPVIVKPSHELLGELLLELGRPGEALESFARALELAPRRSLSLAGQASAARALGREDVAARACAELAEIRRAADEKVEAAACAREGTRAVAGSSGSSRPGPEGSAPGVV